jgi:hypothetical protein
MRQPSACASAYAVHIKQMAANSNQNRDDTGSIPDPYQALLRCRLATIIMQ